jgi:hypothetical protein
VCVCVKVDWWVGWFGAQHPLGTHTYVLIWPDDVLRSWVHHFWRLGLNTIFESACFSLYASSP